MSAPAVIDLLEKDLQKHIRKLAEQLGWHVAVTWNSMNSPKGWPDLFCVRRGEAVAMELKREKTKTTEYQDAWLADLAEIPGVRWAGVIRPSDWYAGKVEELLR